MNPLRQYRNAEETAYKLSPQGCLGSCKKKRELWLLWLGDSYLGNHWSIIVQTTDISKILVSLHWVTLGTSFLRPRLRAKHRTLDTQFIVTVQLKRGKVWNTFLRAQEVILKLKYHVHGVLQSQTDGKLNTLYTTDQK